MTKTKTRRTESKAAKDSTHSGPTRYKFDADRFWSELERKMEELRDWVQGEIEQKTGKALPPRKRRVDRLPKKRGPKTISDAELDIRRDASIQFLESNWPELGVLCGPKPNLKVLRKALIKFAKPLRDGPKARARFGTADFFSPAARRLLENFDQLAEFLTGHQDRFAGDPRQIANAMAGCPNVRFWTSLKRCQRRPSNIVIHERAVKSYIQRKHPKLSQELLDHPSTPQLAALRRRYRTKDKVMIGLKAPDLERFWKKGIPSESSS